MRPRRPAPALLLLAPILALALGSGPVAAEPDETPLPVEKSSLLKDRDTTYVVEGRQTIPSGVEITLQKGVRLVGRGGAVLVVEGQFVAHGISGTEISISGLRIVPGDEVQQLHLDMCDFSGGGVVTEKDRSTDGMITLENCDFGSAPVDLAIRAGKLKVMSVQCGSVLRIRGVAPEGKRNRAEASIRTSSLRGGIEITGVEDVTMRGNALRGTTVLFKDVEKLAFDANKVESGTLAFEQSVAGRFRKTKIDKCDLLCATLRVFAPVGEKTRETVVIQKCWFGGVLDEDELAEIVQDREDDETNAVKVRIKKPSKRPIGLAAEWN